MTTSSSIAEILDPVPLELKTSQGSLFAHEMDWPWLLAFLEQAAAHINKLFPAEQDPAKQEENKLTIGFILKQVSTVAVATRELSDLLLSKSVRDKDGTLLTTEQVASLKPRVALKLIALSLQQNITEELINSAKEVGAQFLRVMPLSAPKKT
jgi:hypothetical protein